MNALEELHVPVRRRFFADQAQAWAARFSWDACADRLARVLLSEIRHREMGSSSPRRAVDLSTVASWPPGDLDDVERRLRKELRVTDTISRGPDGLRVLLTGCDEVGAAKALRRAQVSPAELRLATASWVLCGTGEDGPA
jgi:hypothetical protein